MAKKSKRDEDPKESESLEKDVEDSSGDGDEEDLGPEQITEVIDDIESEKAYEANLVRAYLTDISKIPILNREEEIELSKKIEKGDDSARAKMIVSNLRLVVSLARQYSMGGHNLLDLIQEGNIGLMKSVGKYDPYKNVKFSYYASFWIKAYLLRFVLDNFSLVKIGTTQDQRKLFFSLKKEENKLRLQGIEPDAKVVAKNLKYTNKREIK